MVPPKYPLLAKYGDQGRPPQFYSLKLRRAFEDEFQGYERRGPGGWNFDYAYESRFVDSFAHWFGLVDIERKKDPVSFRDQLTITKSELFDKVIEVEDF